MDTYNFSDADDRIIGGVAIILLALALAAGVALVVRAYRARRRKQR